MITTCPRCHGAKREPLAYDRSPCTCCRGAGHVVDVQLARNFRLSEAWTSVAARERGLPNDPPAWMLPVFVEMAAVLQLIRDAHGVTTVTSWFRSPVVNAAVGGSQTSAHVTGWAADVRTATPPGRLRTWCESNLSAWDQLIEYPGHLHLGVRGPSMEQRRQSWRAG